MSTEKFGVVPLGGMRHGRFVVVNLELHGRWSIPVAYSGGNRNARVGVLGFPTAREAGEFIASAREGLVLGRATKVEPAKGYAAVLLDRANAAYEADNRFLDLWVQADGTVKYRLSIHSDPSGMYRTVKPGSNAMLDLVVQSMLAELGVPFKT